MIVSRSSETQAFSVRSVEGEGVLGGDLFVKALAAGDAMTLLEVQVAAGVGTAMHTHAHESLIYVLRGMLRTTVGGDTYTLGPGDACLHPCDVAHSVEGIEDAVMIEIKSPAVEPASFLGS